MSNLIKTAKQKSSEVNYWLLPASWIYGMGVWVRNEFFDYGLLNSHDYTIPVISVGNITVGGTGKTPHVEYLVRLLKDRYKVAVLSRGYKRRTKGYLLANQQSTANDIGDEPFQIKNKFPKINVAVDANRREGIRRLCKDNASKGVEVVLLDDAFQHRYVRPSLNILLTDYNRPVYMDKLLPAGRLRESRRGIRRADIVIVTKCPASLDFNEIRLITKRLALQEHQELFFSTMSYQHLQPLYCGDDVPLDAITPDENILAISGIAEPRPMIEEIRRRNNHLTHLSFDDHHTFTPEDIDKINMTFESLPSPKRAITTEKDAARLVNIGTLSEPLRHSLFTLPIEVEILQGKAGQFDNYIIEHISRHT